MKTDFLVIKKEELIGIIKEIISPVEIKLHPTTDMSSIIDDINKINSTLDYLRSSLSGLYTSKYYSGNYEAVYFKVPPTSNPQLSTELEIRATYNIQDNTNPSQGLTSVSAFYISKPFIIGQGPTGILNLGTNRTGISYLNSMMFELVKDRRNNTRYVKMYVGNKKAPNSTLRNMYIWFRSDNTDWIMYPESRLPGGTTTLGNLVAETTRETQLESETLRREVPDMDKLVRSDDYSFIKSLTQAQFETMKQNETLREGILYTTDKIEED